MFLHAAHQQKDSGTWLTYESTQGRRFNVFLCRWLGQRVFQKSIGTGTGKIFCRLHSLFFGQIRRRKYYFRRSPQSVSNYNVKLLLSKPQRTSRKNTTQENVSRTRETYQHLPLTTHGSDKSLNTALKTSTMSFSSIKRQNENDSRFKRTPKPWESYVSKRRINFGNHWQPPSNESRQSALLPSKVRELDGANKTE